MLWEWILDLDADDWSAVASWAQTLIALVAFVVALVKLPDWIEERRTVHRSQIATAAIVASTNLLDGLDAVLGDVPPHKGPPDGSMLERGFLETRFGGGLTDRDVARPGHRLGELWRAFLPAYRAALAVLSEEECAPLLATERLWDSIKDQHRLILGMRPVTNPVVAYGPGLRTAVATIQADIAARLYPVAQMKRAAKAPQSVQEGFATPRDAEKSP